MCNYKCVVSGYTLLFLWVFHLLNNLQRIMISITHFTRNENIVKYSFHRHKQTHSPYTWHSYMTTTASLGSSGHWSSVMPWLISRLDRACVSSQGHLFSFQDSLACHAMWCGVVWCCANVAFFISSVRHDVQICLPVHQITLSAPPARWHNMIYRAHCTVLLRGAVQTLRQRLLGRQSQK